MTATGGQREHLAVGSCSNEDIRLHSKIRTVFMRTSTAFGVIIDGPLKISNSQRSEGGLRHGSHGRVGHIPHGPEVEGEVVTDDGSLHPDFITVSEK